MTLDVAQKSRKSSHKVELPLPKQAAESFIPGMNERDDFSAAERVSSSFEK
jgi:hypothetical protein